MLTMRMTKQQLVNFWSKVKRVNSCWAWGGARDQDGYGIVRLFKKDWKAHRVAYELCCKPIEEGLFVLHTCDNPSCVNPRHLFEGTAKDNTTDMFAKGREHDRKGEKHASVKLTNVKVKRIREFYRCGYTQKELGRTFGVSQTNVSMIVRRATWAHI